MQSFLGPKAKARYAKKLQKEEAEWAAKSGPVRCFGRPNNLPPLGDGEDETTTT